MNEIIDKLESLIKTNAPEKFIFNLNKLPDHKNYTIDIRDDKHLSNTLSVLNEKTNDCLYWFSVPQKADAQLLESEINKCREPLKNQQDKRVVPAKNSNLDSNVLYVGVRKGGFRKYTMINRKRVPDELSNIAGRIIQHLGYYKKGSTQGLQLVHWAKNFNFQITLNVVEFQNLPSKEYLYIIEKMYAIKLRPILGKH